MNYGLAAVSNEEQIPPETRLWQAVLANTIEEWVSGPLRMRREAEQYLFSNSKDFKLVLAESAGMNPESLRARLSRLRKQSAEAVDCGMAA